MYPIHIIGDKGQGGTYLLRIRLQTETEIIFGRFQHGKQFTFPPGDYIYVGSALNPRGATSLAPRLLRHATRTGERPPHAIRTRLLERFLELGMGSPRLPKSKKLHWNVDHLIDLLEADLVSVFAIRSPHRLETEIGHWLAVGSGTEIIVPGLGANDVPGGTHLLRVTGDEVWWATLPERLTTLLAAKG